MLTDHMYSPSYALDRGDEGWIRLSFICPKPHVDDAPMTIEFTSKYGETPPLNSQSFTFHASMRSSRLRLAPPDFVTN